MYVEKATRLGWLNTSAPGASRWALCPRPRQPSQDGPGGATGHKREGAGPLIQGEAAPQETGLWKEGVMDARLVLQEEAVPGGPPRPAASWGGGVRTALDFHSSELTLWRLE